MKRRNFLQQFGAIAGAATVTGRSALAASEPVGDLKGKAWGFGPIVQYSREYSGTPVTMGLKVQKVMQHRNRTDDDSVYFNVVVSF